MDIRVISYHTTGTFTSFRNISTALFITIDTDVFVNCNWVDNQWQ